VLEENYRKIFYLPQPPFAHFSGHRSKILFSSFTISSSLNKAFSIVRFQNRTPEQTCTNDDENKIFSLQ